MLPESDKTFFDVTISKYRRPQIFKCMAQFRKRHNLSWGS